MVDEHTKHAARNYLDADKRLTPRRLYRLWQLARHLEQAERTGGTFVDVPKWLVPAVRQMVYEAKVNAALERWDKAVAEVSIADWQAAARQAGKDKLV